MTFLIIFLVALAVSAVGFHRYIWFISIGYGFSIAAIGTALLIMFGVRHELTAVTAIMAALLVVYGLRLGGYLLAREYRSSSYHKVMQQAIDNGNNVKLPLRLLTWVGCALLYMRGLANCLPLAEPCGNRRRRHCGRGDHGRWHHTRIRRGSHEEPVQAATPTPLLRCRALPHGALPELPRRDRHLTGVFVSGVTILDGAWQWIAAIGGYLCICWIMFGGARRLELRQNKEYADDPQYRHYSEHTPILIPFIPLHSLSNAKWLIG